MEVHGRHATVYQEGERKMGVLIAEAHMRSCGSVCGCAWCMETRVAVLVGAAQAGPLYKVQRTEQEVSPSHPRSDCAHQQLLGSNIAAQPTTLRVRTLAMQKRDTGA